MWLTRLLLRLAEALSCVCKFDFRTRFNACVLCRLMLDLLYQMVCELVSSNFSVFTVSWNASTCREVVCDVEHWVHLAENT